MPYIIPDTQRCFEGGIRHRTEKLAVFHYLFIFACIYFPLHSSETIRLVKYKKYQNTFVLLVVKSGSELTLSLGLKKCTFEMSQCHCSAFGSQSCLNKPPRV